MNCNTRNIGDFGQRLAVDALVREIQAKFNLHPSFIAKQAKSDAAAYGGDPLQEAFKEGRLLLPFIGEFWSYTRDILMNNPPSVELGGCAEFERKLIRRYRLYPASVAKEIRKQTKRDGYVDGVEVEIAEVYSKVMPEVARCALDEAYRILRWKPLL